MFFDMDEVGPVGTLMVFPDATYLAPAIDQPIPDETYFQGNTGDSVVQLEGSIG